MQTSSVTLVITWSIGFEGDYYLSPPVDLNEVGDNKSLICSLNISKYETLIKNSEFNL